MDKKLKDDFELLKVRGDLSKIESLLNFLNCGLDFDTGKVTQKEIDYFTFYHGDISNAVSMIWDYLGNVERFLADLHEDYEKGDSK